MMTNMPSLQIRDLPDDIYEALSYRAERAGRSLAQQALVELRKMTQVGSRKRRLEALRRILDRPPAAQDTGVPTPEELIRRDRTR